MTQKYKDGEVVYAPGTVIISAAGEVKNIRKVVEPVLKNVPGSELIYIDFSGDEWKLSGSAFGQVINKIGQNPPSVKDARKFVKAFGMVQDLIEKDLIIAGHDVSAGGLVTALAEMCFPNTELGIDLSLNDAENTDLVKFLFAENPALVVQVENADRMIEDFAKEGIKAFSVGKINKKAQLNIHGLSLSIPELRDTWFRTSFLLDRKQSGERLATLRYENYKKQTLEFQFPSHFTGKFADVGANPDRRKSTGIKAAIIREKGVNADREMAWMMYLAGLDVKDVHMTDLIAGRETLEDINLIVFVGGFSNSDVLGSGKGWAGAFLYNPKAKEALDKFYAREDTLSLGVCNGCQAMIELGLITPEHTEKPKMLHNDSHKYESIFVNVDISENHSVMLKSLAGSRLGIWVAHGEGKFRLPKEESEYHIPMKYSYEEYPGNPNGSDYSVAGLCSADGRHLVMMPHLERAIYPWNWPYYPEERKTDEVSPWIEAFVNARKWIEEKKS